jgi:tetratricopeptide (TPR) repeat protein
MRAEGSLNKFSRASFLGRMCVPRADKGRFDTVDQQTKQALKHDQFIDTTTHGLEWAKENRHSVIVTTAIVLAVVVVGIAGALIYNSRSTQASEAFGLAMQAYQTPLAQAGTPVPAGVKTYSSEGERAKAANALFVAAANKFTVVPEGKNALYFAGLTYMEMGNNSAAEATLKQVADGWNGQLGSLAKLSLADLYRKTGRDAEAIELYNRLTAKPTSTVPAGLAQLQLAELYEAEGKHDQAKAIYAQLKDKDAKGPAGMMAAQKLNPTPAGAPAAAQ